MVHVFDIATPPGHIRSRVFFVPYKIGVIEIVFYIEPLQDARNIINIEDKIIITQPPAGTVGFVEGYFSLQHLIVLTLDFKFGLLILYAAFLQQSSISVAGLIGLRHTQGKIIS
ncbi:hypothetical protein CMK12_04345 [Candidatus Poribacteria bacterium]|nr:hypothetical protein [Candidatus Poribacteria bacterium]